MVARLENPSEWEVRNQLPKDEYIDPKWSGYKRKPDQQGTKLSCDVKVQTSWRAAPEFLRTYLQGHRDCNSRGKC